MIVTGACCCSHVNDSVDNTTPIGPCIVAAHAILDPQSIELSCTLNGEKLQNGTTKHMIFSVARTLSLLSRGTTLLPGSIILTGTPAGVGFVRKPAVYLKHGDEVVVSVGSNIGSCINQVVEEGKEFMAKL